MNKYIQYLKYILKHKYYVARECFKEGLYWRGIVHDMSKLLPDEFIPYVNYFYGEKTESIEKKFDIAWLKHQHRNKHHWQYWLLREDDGCTKFMRIPYEYALEMLCDWKGAGMAITGKDNTSTWYQLNKEKIQLHQETRNYIETMLALDSMNI